MESQLQYYTQNKDIITQAFSKINKNKKSHVFVYTEEKTQMWRFYKGFGPIVFDVSRHNRHTIGTQRRNDGNQE